MSSHVHYTPKAEANSEYHPEVAARRFNLYPPSAVSASRTQYDVPTGMASSLKSYAG